MKLFHKLLIAFFSTLILFSCEPEMVEPYQNYIIKKGEHWSTYKQATLQNETLNFSVIFDESAIYECETPENQYDTNKLLGFSGCNSFHHENSARFGWSWVEGELNISAYCYVDSERIIIPIGTVEINKASDYSLTVTKDEYIFKLDNYPTVTVDRGSDCNIGFYYMLYPYFGGNETAPQDIDIKIRIKY